MTDGADFDAFYARAHVAGQVYLLVGDLGEAQDVAQEAFVRALARWRTVRTLDDRPPSGEDADGITGADW